MREAAKKQRIMEDRMEAALVRGGVTIQVEDVEVAELTGEPAQPENKLEVHPCISMYLEPVKN